MAKGQKRSNREIRKPKQIKKPADESASILLPRGSKPTTGNARKK